MSLVVPYGRFSSFGLCLHWETSTDVKDGQVPCCGQESRP